MSSIVEFLKSFGLSRLATIVGVTAGVGIGLLLIVLRIGAPQYSVLYSDLDYGNAQSVISQLNQDGINFKMRESGSRVAILVPRDKESGLRISLAGNGYSEQDSVGYEIFDGAQPLGTTNFQQNINRLRALEGELSRTVSSISGIRTARVHLVLPERTLFARDQREASASIMIEAARKIDPSTVRAIINLAASAVPELSRDQVTILDVKGTLLASPNSENEDGMAQNAMADRMGEAQTRLQTIVSDLVGSIVGPENVRTQVTADFDFSRFTETSEIVDPDSQVVLSSTIIEESSNDNNPAQSRGVSVSNGLPGNDDTAAEGRQATSSNLRTEEITNYELTKTVRNAVRDEGLIVNRLSVAVAINALTTDGTPITRTPEEIANIEALVKSAIGFDASRGDQVEIATIAFNQTTDSFVGAPNEATTSQPLLSSANIMRLAEVAALLLIAAALVFFVLRPLFMSNSAQKLTSSISPQTSESNGNSASLTTSPNSNISTIHQDNVGQKAIEQRIDIAQIDGQVKASSVSQIQEIVKGHTEESALILKRWIREAI